MVLCTFVHLIHTIVDIINQFHCALVSGILLDNIKLMYDDNVQSSGSPPHHALIIIMLIWHSLEPRKVFQSFLCISNSSVVYVDLIYQSPVHWSPELHWTDEKLRYNDNVGSAAHETSSSCLCNYNKRSTKYFCRCNSSVFFCRSNSSVPYALVSGTSLDGRKTKVR